MFTTLFPNMRRQTHAETGCGKLRPFALTFAMMLGSLLLSSAARANEGVSLPPFSRDENIIITAVLIAGVVSLIFGFIWFQAVNNQSPGTEKMQEVGQAIRDGAMAYLYQQVKMM